MWRKPTQVGVKFERSLADTADASRAPKSGADVPPPDAAPVEAEAVKAD
jgi:hypothetical protein